MEGTSGNPQLWSWLSLPTPWGETRRGGSKSRTPAPTPAQPSGPLHPPPTSRGAGPEPLRMRRPSVPPPAPRPDFPRFTSLPLRRGCSFAATIGCRTSSSRPINATPSPPCYWVEQNKNKQSERGQRRSEAAAEAEERGRGQVDRRPGRAAAAGGGQSGGRGSHARAGGDLLPLALGPGRLAARWEGEGAWRPRRGGRGDEPGAAAAWKPSGPAAFAQRPGLRGAAGARSPRPERGAAARARPLLRCPFPGGWARGRSWPRGAFRCPSPMQLAVGDGSVGEVCGPDGGQRRAARPDPGGRAWPCPVLPEGGRPAGTPSARAGSGRGQAPPRPCANSSLPSPARGP